MRSARQNGTVVNGRATTGMSEARQRLPFSSTLRRIAQTIISDRASPPKPTQRDILAKHPAKRAFTDDQVKLMRILHRAGRITAEELSLLTGLEFCSILKVLDGTNYSKVL